MNNSSQTLYRLFDYVLSPPFIYGDFSGIENTKSPPHSCVGTYDKERKRFVLGFGYSDNLLDKVKHIFVKDQLSDEDIYIVMGQLFKWIKPKLPVFTKELKIVSTYNVTTKNIIDYVDPTLNVLPLIGNKEKLFTIFDFVLSPPFELLNLSDTTNPKWFTIYDKNRHKIGSFSNSTVTIDTKERELRKKIKTHFNIDLLRTYETKIIAQYLFEWLQDNFPREVLRVSLWSEDSQTYNVYYPN